MSSRRAFLRRLAGGAPPVLRPPQSTDESVKTHCSRCGDCAAACPEEVIVFDGDRLPALSFASGKCTFCGRCGDSCKEAVFDRRQPPTLSAVAAVGNNCLIHTGVYCQNCRDACEEQAILFSPSPTTPPVINTAACTGCGACVSICPADALMVTAVA